MPNTGMQTVKQMTSGGVVSVTPDLLMSSGYSINVMYDGFRIVGGYVSKKSDVEDAFVFWAMNNRDLVEIRLSPQDFATYMNQPISPPSGSCPTALPKFNIGIDAPRTPPAPNVSCECGAHACDSNYHSDWCPMKT